MNRSHTLSVQNMTPEEAWNDRKPNVDHFKIFGCICYARIPDQTRTKLDEKGEKCIFLGVSDCYKAYKLYNPITKKIVINRDVIFDEENFWTWSESGSQRQILADFDRQDEAENQHNTVVVQQPITAQDEQVVTQVSAAVASEPRSRKRPIWIDDYEVTGIGQSEDPAVHFALFGDCDHVTFEEAVKQSKWRKAMDEELAAIERNNTWKLTELP